MDDVAVVVEMRRRLADSGFGERCVAVDWTPIPEDFMRDVSGCDLFVATRMHSAILALNAGVPVVGVAYEEKMRGLLETFDLGDLVVDVESPERIVDVVRSGYARRADLRQVIAKAGPAIRLQASLAMELAARSVTVSV
jgi:polysaccharide pyruvyl transferase WcaK-like protein